MAKKMLQKSTNLNMEKDLRLKQLMAESIESDINKNAFDEYADHFEAIELKNIRSVGPGQANDSTFVLQIMRSLYKDDESQKLQHRSSTGRRYNGSTKLEITMDKKKTMKSMLIQRVTNELKNKMDSSIEMSKRVSKLNELIKNAIHTIVRATDRSKRKREDDIDDTMAKRRKQNEINVPNAQVNIFE